MKTKSPCGGFIQIPILIAIFIGLVVVGGGTYEGVKVYKEKQEIKKEEKRVAQATEDQVVPDASVSTETATSSNDATGTPEVVEPVAVTATPSRSVAGDKPTVITSPKPTSAVTPPKPTEKLATPAPTPAATTPPINPPTPIVTPTTTQPTAPTTPTPEVVIEQALNISDFGVVPGDSTADFHWTTSIPGVGKIIYWEQGQPNKVIWSPTSLSIYHYANITKLTPGTTYNYTIEVVIPSSSKSVSKTGSFTTTGSLIQAVVVEPTPYAASIRWTTSVQSTFSFVMRHGETTLDVGKSSDSSGKQHQAWPHDSLTPNTTYDYTITATPSSGGASQTHSGTIKTNPLLEVSATPSPSQTVSMSSTTQNGDPRMCVDCSATLIRALVNWKYDRMYIVGYTIEVQGYESIAAVGLLPNQGEVTGGSPILTKTNADHMFPPDTFSTELQFYFKFVGPPTGTGAIQPTLTSITVRDSNGVTTKIPTSIPGTIINY